MLKIKEGDWSGIYFTSDLHLAHKNIIEYDGRPFKTIEEHDKSLIDNINKVCESTSLLFVLGDLSMCKDMTYIDKLLDQVQCTMVLIKGNHDKHLKQAFLNKHFIEVHDYLEVKTSANKFILSHFPFYSWDGNHRGSIHLHGHTHKMCPELNGKHFNVGVCNSDTYSPYSLNDILTITSKQTLGDYRHG